MFKVNYKLISSILLATILLVYGIAFFVGKYFFTPEKIKQTLILKLEEGLNKPVNIGGDIQFKLGLDLSPHVIIPKIQIQNVFTADHVDIEFSAISVFTNKFKIDSLNLKKPTIYLQNIPKGDEGSSLKINNLEIYNGTIHFDSNTKLSINSLEISDLDINANGDLKFNVNELQLRKTDLKGNVKYTKNPLKIHADFKSKVFNAEDLLTPGNSTYSVPNYKIPIEQLKDGYIDINFDINKFYLDNLKLEDFNIAIKSEDKKIISKFQPNARLANGQIVFNSTYDLNKKTPQLKINLETKNLLLEQVLKSISGKSFIDGSAFSFKANLTSSGSDTRRLVRNMRGLILATAGPGKYLNSNSSLSSFFYQVTNALFTFKKSQPVTNFNCAVAKFKVNNGIAQANNGLGLEASSVNVIGRGTIDFNTGNINFKINPKNLSKNPLDIAEFTMAQGVSIGGTITDPSVNFSPISIVTEAIKNPVLGGLTAGIPAAITGAITKEMGLTESSPIPNEPCKVALDS